ncbi:Shedu immune nuclease family protein [Lewinella sp. IMCC34183]|uniref:Shedu immune nuclease family protein n=1 Tax=Lewinella sp. IMCC34183 TaxID=2248762 RepID=UPI000E2304C6|nr:Shedu immune nuclease family protein [Lewinella sp. IMCC34183]
MYGNHPKPSKEEIIGNSFPDRLYTAQHEKVKFYRVVFKDGDTTTYQASARTQVQLTRKVSDGEFEAIEIVKLVDGEIRQRIKLPKFTLERICGFLELMRGEGIDTHRHRRSILTQDEAALGKATRESVIETLSGEDGTSIVAELLDRGALLEKDLINTGYRRQQLGWFSQMLYEGRLEEYKALEMNRPKTKDEIAWQHFFSNNEWIFGYGLTYRFNTILQKEFAASGTTAAGKDQVNADFLTGDTRFTSFVELKRPDTPLFGTGLNRARTWALSKELQDAKSQILEQKASGMIKAETEKELLDSEGNLILQRTFDPRIILVIGCWDQIEGDNLSVRTAKQKTFELYRRDSRNVEFITFDELYERACHIVGDPTTGAKVSPPQVRRASK